MTATERTKAKRRSSRYAPLLITLCCCQTSNSFLPGMPAQGGSGGHAPAAGTSSSSAPAAVSGMGGVPNITQPLDMSAGTGAAPAGRNAAANPQTSSGGASAVPALAGAGSAAPTMTAGSMAAAAGTAAVSGECRPSKYSFAMRAVVKESWAETLGLLAGSGASTIWVKLGFERSADNITTSLRACGIVPLAYMTNALGGGIKVLQGIPFASWDQPSMPTATGKAIRTGDRLNIESGTLLAGIALTDPLGPWPTSPTAAGSMPVDHDGDGKPGITTRYKDDDVYTPAPSSILQTQRLDANYAALRVSFALNAPANHCADTLEGTGMVKNYDLLIVGCHIKNGGDCTADEASFVEEVRPKWQFGDLTWTARAIADDATCAQVREAVPSPDPVVLP